MGVIKTVAVFIWRIWFYVLMVVPILVMFPFLILFTSSERFYPQYFFCSRIWAKTILYGMGFYVEKQVAEKLIKGKSYMLVANHTSMLDIMLMLTVIKQPFVFIGKKELAQIPIFGFFYRRTCILVDRKCTKSRQQAFKEAQRRLKQGNSMCIFPEGGVPNDYNLILDGFKDGAFRLAIEHQIPIVPLTFHDNKRRFSYRFLSGKPGKLRVKIHHHISTLGKTMEERRALKEKTHAVILEELQNPGL